MNKYNRKWCTLNRDIKKLLNTVTFCVQRSIRTYEQCNWVYLEKHFLLDKSEKDKGNNYWPSPIPYVICWVGAFCTSSHLIPATSLELSFSHRSFTEEEIEAHSDLTKAFHLENVIWPASKSESHWLQSLCTFLSTWLMFTGGTII